MVKTKKNHIKTFLVSLFICRLLVAPAYAFSFSSWYAKKTWHPVIAIGAGTSTSSDVGKSQNFPIQNPATDEFYNYSANHLTQTSGFFDGFLGAEWNIYPGWALQAGIDYNQATSFSAKGTLLQGADAGSADSYAYHYSVLTKQLLMEGKLLYPIYKHYYPYLLGGLGVAFNKAYHYYTNVPPLLSFTRTYATHSTTSFSYAVGIGIDTDVTQNMRLGIGYRFADLGQVALGNATIDTSSASGTLSQQHLYTNEVLAQVTWVFS